jgi:hypothetical protein
MLNKKVQWTSAEKTKSGVVVAVVRAGRSPTQVIRSDPSLARYRIYNSITKPSNTRDHESYLVAVDNDLYWPLVSKLQWEEEL